MTPAHLHKFFMFSQSNGKLFWRERDASTFNATPKRTANHIAKTWNAQYALKEAGSVAHDGYVRISLGSRKRVFGHRVVWAMCHGAWPSAIDHINGIRSDNRLPNLREVTLAENNKNLGMRANNKSGVCGVTWDAVSQKWLATIRASGKTIYLGLYTEIHDAAAARKIAEKKYGFHRNHGQARWAV